MKALAGRGAGDPMAAVDDPAQQALLAEALLGETRPPEEAEVASSLQQVQESGIESRLRQLRASIAEAERRGDSAEIAILMKQKMELDNALRRLHRDNHQ
jgi:DNA primase